MFFCRGWSCGLEALAVAQRGFRRGVRVCAVQGREKHQLYSSAGTSPLHFSNTSIDWYTVYIYIYLSLSLYLSWFELTKMFPSLALCFFRKGIRHIKTFSKWPALNGHGQTTDSSRDLCAIFLQILKNICALFRGCCRYLFFLYQT